MRYIFFIIVIFYLNLSLKAQFVKESYRALISDSRQPAPKLFSLGKSGLFFYQTQSSTSNKLNLHRLGNELDSIWVIPHEFPNNYRVINHYFDKKLYFYILAAPYSNKEFSVLQVNLITGEKKTIQAGLPFYTNMEDFRVLEGNVFIIGEQKNDKVALKLGVGQDMASVIPSFYERKMQIKGLFEDAHNNEMNFLVSYRDDCEFALKSYSNILGIKPAEELKIGEEYSINQGFFHSFNHNKKLVLGTYSLRCNDDSEGIGALLYQDNSKPKVSYLRFSDFRNYFNYMKEKRVNRILKRIEKRQNKGKPFILRDKILLKPELIQKNENEWLVVAEGYDEEYSTNTRQRPNRRGTITSQVLVGYEFNNSTIFALDSTGKKTWDNTVKLENTTKKKLENILEVGFLEDSIILAYETEGQIYSKLIHRYEVQVELTEQKVSNILDDPDLSTYNNQFIHWYDNYFLLVGPRQRFFSNQQPYYIYKIAYKRNIDDLEEDSQ